MAVGWFPSTYTHTHTLHIWLIPLSSRLHDYLHYYGFYWTLRRIAPFTPRLGCSVGLPVTCHTVHDTFQAAMYIARIPTHLTFPPPFVTPRFPFGWLIGLPFPFNLPVTRLLRIRWITVPVIAIAIPVAGLGCHGYGCGLHSSVALPPGYVADLDSGSCTDCRPLFPVTVGCGWDHVPGQLPGGPRQRLVGWLVVLVCDYVVGHSLVVTDYVL